MYLNETQQKKEMLQWHPAFYAGIQIELAADRENLIFENEHQLGTKPMGIDVLIIKRRQKPEACAHGLKIADASVADVSGKSTRHGKLRGNENFFP